MAFPVNVDSTWVNPGSVTLDAGELRRADAALFGGVGSALGVGGGIVRHGDTSLAVTIDASDNVTIQPGAVVIPGNAVSGTGCYRSALAAATTNALTARHATNSRIDLIVFRQMDTDVVAGHGAYTGRIEAIAGTPSATPSAPALPSMAVELARITVPATGGGTGTVDSSFRTYAAGPGGKLLVPTKPRLPASATTGQDALALDTLREYMWTGALWQPKQTTGTQTVSFTSQTSATVVVSFGETFAVAPDVQTNIHSGSGTTAGWGSRAISITTTGFTLFVFTTSSSGTWASIPVKWLATASA